MNELVLYYGWDGLGQQIEIRCFNFEPSMASSLKFLRRTPWARTRVELLYMNLVKTQASTDTTPEEPQ